LTQWKCKIIRSLDGKKVLLVDGDDQGTASDWVDHRMGLGITTPWITVRLKGMSVRHELIKMKEDYDDVIIDCGGRDTASLRAALTISDIFIVPFQPKSFDIWTISQVSEVVNEALSINPSLQAYSFINCGGARGKDNEEAQGILKQVEGIKPMPVSIGLRKAFSNATAEGLGVVEFKPQDKKANSEIKTLYRHIFDIKKTSKR
jgi:chromosome partitioning protein